MGSCLNKKWNQISTFIIIKSREFNKVYQTK
jgi:hypothetical protein